MLVIRLCRIKFEEAVTAAARGLQFLDWVMDLSRGLLSLTSLTMSNVVGSQAIEVAMELNSKALSAPNSRRT